MEHALVQILKNCCLTLTNVKSRAGSWLMDRLANQLNDNRRENEDSQKELQGKKMCEESWTITRSDDAPSTCWAHRQEQKLITGASSS